MAKDKKEEKLAVRLARKKGYKLRGTKAWDEERRHISAINIATGEVIAYASHCSGITKFLNQQPDLCHRRCGDDTS